MMKQSVLLALLLGLLSACQPSVEDILKENDYAKSFDYVWNTLDANYPYFDYVTIDMDKKSESYENYIRRTEKITDTHEFRKLLHDFTEEFNDPNIILNYSSQGISCLNLITSKDYRASNLCATDKYIGGQYEEELNNGECAIEGPFLFKWVYREMTNGSRNIYPLIVCFPSGEIRPDSIADNILQKLTYYSSLIQYYPSTKGIVLDLRCCYCFDSDFIQKLAPYMFEKGKHELYPSPASSNVPYTIEGNGLLANIPIAVIVNEGTIGESSWLARVLQPRENIAIVGRANAGPGCIRVTSEEKNGISVTYPSARIERDGTTFYDPLVPEILVDWAGGDATVLGVQGEYSDNLDYCLSAALDFIDSY